MTTAPAFIFDFDGLLVDTESTVLRAWREQFAVYDLAFPLEVWHRYIGSKGSQEAMLAALRSSGIAFEDTKFLGEFRERHNGIVRDEFLREGVEAFLDAAAAAGSKLAVASSATRDWLDEHLDRLAIRGRLAALQALSGTAANAVAFEDSPNRIAAAKAAGLYCVAVPNPVTTDLPLDQADLRVGSFAELTVSGLVERLRTAPGYAAANVQAPAP